MEVVVQSLRPIALCSLKECSTPGFPVLHYLPECAQTQVHWVSDAIQPSHRLLPSSPALDLFQQQGLFQWVSSLCQVAKVWLQHQSFQWVFRVDFLYYWLVGSPCCPRDSEESFQHHSRKASILQCSAFFIVRLSHPYMTTDKTIGLTVWTLASKAMSLLFNLLSRFVMAFLPRSKHLLISWLQSILILEPKKRKSVTASPFPPSIFPWSDGTRCHDLSIF